MSKLTTQEIIEHVMFDAIARAAGLPRDIGQATPHQYGAGNVIALAAGLATLAALNTRELLRFTMKLLDLPAQAARVLCRLYRILSLVVRDDPVRAVCGHLDPEQLQLVMLRKTLDLDCLAVGKSVFVPLQQINPPVRRFTARIIDQAIIAQRAVVRF